MSKNHDVPAHSTYTQSTDTATPKLFSDKKHKQVAGRLNGGAQ